MDAFFNGDDYEGLEKLVEQIQDGSPILIELAEYLLASHNFKQFLSYLQLENRRISKF